MNGVANDEATKALAVLATQDRQALAKQWVLVFGHSAPRGAQVTLLRGALAWHYQIAHEAVGEVDQLMRRLRRHAASQGATTILTPGTRLVREWQGQTHHVTVVGAGFEYAGMTYKSLTAIARQITGTAWSGPLFFGLRK